MAVASFECSAINDEAAGLTDVDVVLNADVGRSDPVDGATLIVIGIWAETTAGNYEVDSVTDDAPTNSFYGTTLFADGKNQYGPCVFRNPVFNFMSQTGLILHPLSSGDTITLTFQGSMNAVRTYARAYTGVRLNRAWTTPDEISITDLLHTGIVGYGYQAAFSEFHSPSETEGWFTAEGSVFAATDQFGMTPGAGLNPVVTASSAGLGVWMGNVFGGAGHSPIAWENADITVVESWEDQTLGAGPVTTMSWGEEVIAASDVMNPLAQYDIQFSLNVLVPGPGPRGPSAFTPHIYRRH